VTLTPGPWETCFVAYEGHPYYVNTVPHYQGGPKLHGSAGAIAKLPASKFHDQAANARLIAAAPDLLEALIWMVENDETFEGDTPLPDHHGATWNEINAYWIAGLNRARAAIAKATGEGE